MNPKNLSAMAMEHLALFFCVRHLSKILANKDLSKGQVQGYAITLNEVELMLRNLQEGKTARL